MAGCAGLGCSVAALMFVGLAVWTIFVGLKQNSAIAAFSEDEQKTYSIEAPAAPEAELLNTKLQILAKAAETKQATTVELSVEDLNDLIATQDLLADLRGNTRVSSVEPSHIAIQMSRPVRKLPMGFRYVNGTYSFRPEKIGDAWELTLLDIAADAGVVDPNFVAMFRELQLLRFDPRNANLKPVLKQLKAVELKDGHVALTTWEGDPPQPVKS